MLKHGQAHSSTLSFPAAKDVKDVEPQIPTNHSIAPAGLHMINCPPV